MKDKEFSQALGKKLAKLFVEDAVLLEFDKKTDLRQWLLGLLNDSEEGQEALASYARKAVDTPEYLQGAGFEDLWTRAQKLYARYLREKASQGD